MHAQHPVLQLHMSCEYKDLLEKAEFVKGLTLSCLFCSEKKPSRRERGNPHDLPIPHSFH